MNKSTNSNTTNSNYLNKVKSSSQASLNKSLTTQHKAMQPGMVKTILASNESLDLNSNCFVLGYN